MEEAIRIESRVYRPTGHGEFEIPLSELGALTFTGVPFYSTLTVKPLPVAESGTVIRINEGDMCGTAQG